MIYFTGDTHREQDVAKINPDDKFPKGKELFCFTTYIS